MYEYTVKKVEWTDDAPVERELHLEPTGNRITVAGDIKLSVTEAKAMARYLNSWAGLVEAHNADGITPVYKQDTLEIDNTEQHQKDVQTIEKVRKKEIKEAIRIKIASKLKYPMDHEGRDEYHRKIAKRMEKFYPGSIAEEEELISWRDSR